MILTGKAIKWRRLKTYCKYVLVVIDMLLNAGNDILLIPGMIFGKLRESEESLLPSFFSAVDNLAERFVKLKDLTSRDLCIQNVADLISDSFLTLRLANKVFKSFSG